MCVMQGAGHYGGIMNSICPITVCASLKHAIVTVIIYLIHVALRIVESHLLNTDNEKTEVSVCITGVELM